MTQPELKPCPFCGSKAYVSENSDTGWPRCVECENEDCEAIGPWAKREHNHEQALAYIVERWNRRAHTNDHLPKLSDLIGLCKDNPIDVAGDWDK